MLKFNKYINDKFIKIYLLNLENNINFVLPTMWDFLFEVIKNIFWGETKPKEPQGDFVFPETPPIYVYSKVSIKKSNIDQNNLNDDLKESINSYIKEAVDRAVNESIREIVEKSIMNDESLKKNLHDSLENSLFDWLHSSLRESLNESRDDALYEEINFLNDLQNPYENSMFTYKQQLIINTQPLLQINDPNNDLIEISFYTWQWNCYYFNKCGSSLSLVLKKVIPNNCYF